MCGIAGFVNLRPGHPSPGVIDGMITAMRHRGPDGSGVYSDSHAVLGHRRLAIVDVSAGHQPMSNEEGTLWVTYNGEIYNHLELRQELIRAGHHYKTRCDTESILHSYEEYGPGCIERFRGMFSFALWDAAARRLFCARDRMGIKPFYYYWNGRLFAFASEIKSLLRHPEISANVNVAAISEYLAFGYLSGEETMFRGIRKLMPGHSLCLDLNAASSAPAIQQFWDVPQPAPEREWSELEVVEECRARLGEAVRTRLMSDVPLGTFLSGGLDSSAITALMTRMSPERVKTFSVGYDEAGYSELGHAQRVADFLGTDHHATVVTSRQFFSALPTVVWHEDEPSVFSSSVPLYFVSKLAAEHVKVVLSGEGSDELFGGYERYRYYGINTQWAKRYGFVPNFIRSAIRRQIDTNHLLSGDLRRKIQHTFVGRANTFEALQLENFYCAFSRAEIDSLSRESAAPPFRNVLEYWRKWEGSSEMARLLYADQKTYLVELLMRQDQMSMAASIESRVPFLDHPFVEFSMRVPDSLTVRGRHQKVVLKKAVEGLLPPDIIHREKMGFPTPLRRWFRDPANRSVLEQLTTRDGFLASLLDIGRVRTLLDRHRGGTEDGTDRIWRLLNLQIWGGLFIEGRVHAPEMALAASS